MKRPRLDSLIAAINERFNTNIKFHHDMLNMKVVVFDGTKKMEFSESLMFDMDYGNSIDTGTYLAELIIADFKLENEYDSFSRLNWITTP